MRKKVNAEGERILLSQLTLWFARDRRETIAKVMADTTYSDVQKCIADVNEKKQPYLRASLQAMKFYSRNGRLVRSAAGKYKNPVYKQWVTARKEPGNRERQGSKPPNHTEQEIAENHKTTNIYFGEKLVAETKSVPAEKPAVPYAPAQTLEGLLPENKGAAEWDINITEHDWEIKI